MKVATPGPATQPIALEDEDTQPLSSDDEAGISITDRQAEYLALDRPAFIAFIKWRWLGFHPGMHPFLTSEQWIYHIPYEFVIAYNQSISSLPAPAPAP